MKMMIVDDSTIVRRKIERDMALQGVSEVIHASNGCEAVDLCSAHQPELVTMDLTMPQMDGAECIKELVAINPNILILVISALSDKSTAIEAIKNGARGFICKPFTDEQLNNALMKILSDARQLKKR